MLVTSQRLVSVLVTSKRLVSVLDRVVTVLGSARSGLGEASSLIELGRVRREIWLGD